MQVVSDDGQAMPEELAEKFEALKKKRKLDDASAHVLAADAARLVDQEVARWTASITELQELLARDNEHRITRVAESNLNRPEEKIRFPSLPKVVFVHRNSADEDGDPEEETWETELDAEDPSKGDDITTNCSGK